MAKTPTKTRSKAGKPARKALPKAVKKKAVSKKALKKGAKKPLKKMARKPAATPARRAAKRAARPKATAVVRKVANVVTKKAAAPARKPAPVKKTAPAKKAAVPPPARLQRQRRVLPEAEAGAFTGVSNDSRLLSSARSGHDELRAELKRHTEGGPELTAGDVDAKWQDAYALGDEAPGGDNMTPDQDRVDDIGKALGVEYADDEELMGGDEIAARDVDRWELDPESKDEDE